VTYSQVIPSPAWLTVPDGCGTGGVPGDVGSEMSASSLLSASELSRPV